MSKRRRHDGEKREGAGRPALYPGKVRDRNSSYAFTQDTHDKIDDVQNRLTALHGRPISRTEAVEHMIIEFPIGSLRKRAS